MTTDTHCSMCKQQLRPGREMTHLYYPHEDYTACIRALAARVEELEYNASMNKRLKKWDE